MIKNQVVLLTGGAGRIGSAFCKGIIENRGKLIIGDISKEKGNALERSLQTEHAFFVEVDTSDTESIKNLIELGKNHFGRIDSAVHCAYPRSKQWGTPFEEVKAKDLSKNLFSQLGGAILFSQQIISYFRDQKSGHLIHIASIQGVRAPKFEHYKDTEMTSPIEYTAMKAAVIAVTQYLSKYCKNQNIRVNSISPGGILDNQPSNFLKKYAESCNSKGMLDAEDVVGALIFLLSDQSTFINGQNIIIDDGWSL